MAALVAKTRNSKQTKASKGDKSRQHIIEKSLEIFGRSGFEGASTRSIAAAAEANLGSIQYHFGGKEGLYIAAAEFVADRISADLKGPLSEARTKLHGSDVSRDEGFEILCSVLDRFCLRLIGRRESNIFARFIFREQMEESAAFDALYEGVMRDLVETCVELVRFLDLDGRDDSTIRMLTLTILGQIVLFESSRGVILKTLGEHKLSADHVSALQAMVRHNVEAILKV
ncbi:CerR family C-terminal domain-containing protein [uncultured Tateyamaria sp.]|uniref:CerR family C-terminal domain-containing protein n=1 Tax=uncultured Tateyamaria sp. TaxID=455651 RepID=UPI002631A7BC|nr:CerR family C-terminal domain-containing protein [uncultured Tateyamaria sp.]